MIIPFSLTTIITLECSPANGPSVISKPFALPKLPSGKSDKLTTFSSPSAPQKRFCAKGKSLETHKTVVFSKVLALSLNLRTDAAHVPVSTLGKIFKTNFLPAKSLNEATERSVLTNLKSAIFVPTFGNSPEVCIGFPPNVI